MSLEIQNSNKQFIYETINKSNHTQQNIDKNNQINAAILNSMLRKQGGCAAWLLITTISASIPLLNLSLIIFQDPNLGNAISKIQIEDKYIGKQRSYKNPIIVSSIYILINVVFISYSLYLTSLKQMLKKYFLIQNIFICCLAADVCYAAVHIVCITSVYKTDSYYFLQSSYDYHFIDVFVIILYTITNFSLTGIFKILMVDIHWKPYQIIIYKLAIMISSLFYFIYGIIFIIGKDNISQEIDNFINRNAKIITQLYLTQKFSDLQNIPFYQNINTSMKQAKNTVVAFIILYVFTNFALFFEIIAKMSDFDLTCDLKADYTLVQQSQK